MVYTESNDRVDLVNDLLVFVQIELIVIKLDYELRITSIHSTVNRCVNLLIQHLNVTINHREFLQFCRKVSFTVTVILWSPFINLAESDFVDCLFYFVLSFF